MILINHFVFADEGRVFGSSSDYYENNTRDVIQEWQTDKDNPCRDAEHKMGEIRRIRQIYRKKPLPNSNELWDPTTTHYWDPPIPDRTYKNY